MEKLVNANGHSIGVKIEVNTLGWLTTRESVQHSAFRLRQENPHCLLLTEGLHEEFDPLPMPTLSLPGVKIAPSSSVKHIIHTSTQPSISIFKGATSSQWVQSPRITLAPVTTQGSCWKVKVLRDGIISMLKSRYGRQIFAQFYRCTHWTQGLRGILWAPRG